MRRSATGPVSAAETFWQHPDTVGALRRRDLGRLLRLFGVHTGASQTRLGEATGLSQGQVSQVMNGSRRISNLDVLERIAVGLAMPDEARMWLGLAPTLDVLPPTSHKTDLLPATLADASASLDRLSMMDTGTRAPHILLFDAAGFVRPSRNWLVKQLTVDSHTLVNQTTTGTAVAIRDTFAAFQEVDTKHGGTHAYAAIVHYLRSQVLPALKNDGAAGARFELYSAASELVYLAGMTAFDSGLCGLAQRYFTIALQLADEGRDHAFAGNVLAAMAHLSNVHRQGYESVQLAQAGLVVAKRTHNQALSMRLSVALARGWGGVSRS